MTNRYFNIFLTILFIILLFSCVSSSETKYQITSKLREKVEKYNLKKYAEEEYMKAEEEYQEAKKLLDSKKNYKADKILDNVNNKYQIILDKGLPLYTDEQELNVKDKKNKALEIKANVAVKNEFEEAEKIYNEALSYKEKKDYEKAIETLNKSEEQFKNIYNTAEEKKIRAENSIKSTEEAFEKIKKESKDLE